MRSALISSFAKLTGWVSCLVIVIAIASISNAQTQITTGTIQGTVSDANGAAVPGASVEVKNTETNFLRTVTTDDEGRFTVLQLPPGKYTVIAWREGQTPEEKPMEVTVTANGAAKADFSFGTAATSSTKPSLQMMPAIEFPMLGKH